jgi:polyisoprenoid-binding protein YceI
VSATGKITVHGIEKEKTITGTLQVMPGEKLILEASFDILLVEHNIERPAIVTMKIAEKIDVKARYELLPFKR